MWNQAAWHITYLTEMHVQPTLGGIWKGLQGAQPTVNRPYRHAANYGQGCCLQGTYINLWSIVIKRDYVSTTIKNL
jgi:hypothetical protein